MNRFACVLGILLGLPAVVSAAELGLAKDEAWNSEQHAAVSKVYELAPNTIYYPLLAEGNVFDWVQQNYLDQDVELTMTLIIRPPEIPESNASTDSDDVEAEPGSLLRRIVNGEFDSKLNEFAEDVAEDGRPLWIRPLHEIDGSWYPWGMYYPGGNTPALACAAYHHVVDAFRAAGADNVSWEVNFNRRDGRDAVLGEAEFLIPCLEDENRVDAYAVSTYNRCGSSDRYPDERSFAAEFRPIYDRIATLSGLPINVAETSTTGLCAPKVPWFREQLEAIDAEFPRVNRVTYYFGKLEKDEASNTVPVYWGFQMHLYELEAFQELIRSYRAEHDDAQVPPAEPAAPRRQAAVTRQQSPSPKPTQPMLQQQVAASSKPRLQMPTSVPQPAQQSSVSASPKLTFAGFDSAPWSAWGRFTVPFGETSNPAISGLSDEPYGTSGPLFRWTLNQRGLWDEGDFEHGFGLHLGGVHSINQTQYWNNALDVGLTYGLYDDFSRDGAIDWGGWSAELYAGRRQYLAPAPDRFGNNGEWRLEFNLGYSFGGDWNQ